MVIALVQAAAQRAIACGHLQGGRAERRVSR
jgi:hypothetical protein